MKVEALIYIYLYVCVCIIIFDIIYLVRVRSLNVIQSRRAVYYERLIRGDISVLLEGKPLNRKKQQVMVKKLCSPNRLIAFLEAYSNLKNELSEIPDDYIKSLIPGFNLLAVRYNKKRQEYRAYFAHAVSQLNLGKLIGYMDVKERTAVGLIAGYMIEFLSSDSVYVWDNAFRALFSIGYANKVVRAVKVADITPGKMNEKLLTDGLLSFLGSHSELVTLLWGSYDEFTPQLKVVILNYLRLLPKTELDQSEFFEKLCNILGNNLEDQEVRLAVLRYFRKYQYDEVQPILTDFIEHSAAQDWEYAAVAASVLSSYPGEKTQEVLLDATGSPNWYVRFNSAESLVQLGLQYEYLNTDEMDSYAKGMLSYRSQIDKLKRGEQ